MTTMKLEVGFQGSQTQCLKLVILLCFGRFNEEPLGLLFLSVLSERLEALQKEVSDIEGCHYRFIGVNCSRLG
jgi:hypothetical protein